MEFVHWLLSRIHRGAGRRSRAVTVAVVAVTSLATLLAIPAAQAASTGGVLGTGYDGYGQLCNGTTTGGSTASGAVSPLDAGATATAAGAVHSLALTTGGAIFACGNNLFGQLGNGTTTNSSTPVAVILPGGASAAAIAADEFHSLALTSGGAVYAWGHNAFGQLGNGTTTDSSTPVAVSPGSPPPPTRRSPASPRAGRTACSSSDESPRRTHLLAGPARDAGGLYFAHTDGSRRASLDDVAEAFFLPLTGTCHYDRGAHGTDRVDRRLLQHRPEQCRRLQPDVMVPNPPSVTLAVSYNSPDLSPDGKQIVMGSSTAGIPRSSQLYIAGTDGSAPRRADETGTIQYWPRWSPDGTQIASAELEGANGVRDIVTMLADGTGQKVVIGNGDRPSWSPGGGSLVFVSGGNIMVVNTDGSQLHTPAPGAGPAIWSPDGTEIAFQQAQARGVRVIKADGTSQTVTDAAVSLQSWSPDGHRLLVIATPSGHPPGDLEVIDAASGAVLQTLASNVVDASWQHPR